MPIQRSPPARQRSSLAAPSRKEGRGPRRSNYFSGVVGGVPRLSRTTFKGPGEEEEEENSVEEEEYDGTEGVPAPMGHPKQMTQIMANIHEASRPPAFKTPYTKAPEFINGTQPLRVSSFIQNFQLIFHNNPENFLQVRKKVLYATSFLIGRDSK
ncbi:hypothetical protein O181_041324 [Austropuccinia psidii MF-1]|uniref:Uncharacterized protein n=1 Tax=Austropuccinia psidii MF-1 TaxID=1389203 RepID=A0A9Q3HGD4_9BASI|nr:hypothetical protein [Austropuccinia psidii MF-1]